MSTDNERIPEGLMPDGFIVQGLPGLWPRFGLYDEDGERIRVFWGWTAVHATVRAIRYAHGLEKDL